MNSKSTRQTSVMERMKWFGIAVLLVASMIANYYYAHVTLPLRLISWLLLVIVIAGIAATTTKGKQAIAFARDSQNEIKKVVWPTRQETVQTSLIVLVIVVIAAVMLWLLDSLLLWAISSIT